MSESNKINFKLVQKIQYISNSTFQPLSFMNNFVSEWMVFLNWLMVNTSLYYIFLYSARNFFLDFRTNWIFIQCFVGDTLVTTSEIWCTKNPSLFYYLSISIDIGWVWSDSDVGTWRCATAVGGSDLFVRDWWIVGGWSRNPTS